MRRIIAVTSAALLIAGALLSPGPVAAAGSETISGTVTFDAGSNHPWLLYVNAYSADDRETPVASTHPAADGTYSLSLPGPGDYVIEFRSYHLEVTEWWPDVEFAADATPIAVADGAEVGDVDAHVTRGGTFWVQTYHQTGEYWETASVGSVNVHVYRVDPDTDELTEVAGSPLLTDWEGLAQTPSLVAGTYTFRYDDEDAGAYPPLWFGGVSDSRNALTRDVQVGVRSLHLVELKLAHHYFDTRRIQGSDRWHTAALTSQRMNADGSGPVVFLANGLNFPDALSAGPAVIAAGGTLLTTAADSLPAATAAELERLQPSEVRVIGGENAVSPSVFDEVASIVAGPVTRIEGATRWQTSERIVRSAFPSGAETVFVATGVNYPDALAAGPAAGFAGAPLVLIDGSGAALTNETRKLLQDLATKRVVVVGGTSAISSALETQLRDVSGVESVERLAGQDRFETAVAINARFFPGSQDALLASGYGFADALAGAPLAGMLAAPLYLTRPDCVPEPVLLDLWEVGATTVTLVGGPAVIDYSVDGAIEQGLSCG